MAPVEDRRKVSTRLDGAAVCRRRCVLRCWPSASGSSRSSSTRSSRRWRRTTICARSAARAARRAVRPRRQGAGREPPLLQHLDRPRAHEGPRPRRSGCSPQVLGLDERRQRDRRSPPPRADVPADHRSSRTRRSRRSPPSRRAGSIRAARRRRRAGADAAAIPTRWRAHLFGYVGEVNDAQVGRRRRLKSGDIVGQAGIEKVYNKLLMGEDGAKRVVVNSVGREIRTLEEDAADRGQAPAADDRLRHPEGDRGRVQRAASGSSAAPRSCSIRATARCSAFTSRPAYDPNAFAAGMDRPTWASLNTDEHKPLQNRAIQGRYRPARRSRWRSRSPALEEGIITPDFKVYCPGHANFYGRSSTAG